MLPKTQDSLRYLIAINAAIALLLSVVVVLGPLIPSPTDLPKRDSGVFLYAGQQIIAGKLPYVDVWDHKGPLIHYLNALGLWLADGNRMGVWLIELSSLIVAVTASVLLLWMAFGFVASSVAASFWLMTLPLMLERGNLTEEYALPLQFLALLFFFLGVTTSRSRLMFLLTGIVGGLAVLLRPNIVGIWLAISLFLITTAVSGRSRVHLQWFGTMIAGVAFPIGLASLFFWTHGALDELASAVIIYNLVYSHAIFAERLDAVQRSAVIALSSGMLITSMMPIVFFTSSVRFKPVSANYIENPLVLIAFIALPIEVLLYSMSGRTYNHYFISVLPTLAILTALFVHIAVTELGSTRGFWVGRGTPWKQKATVVATLLALLLLARRTVLNLEPLYQSFRDANFGSTTPQRALTIDELPDNSEYLLMWGAESAYNFALKMESPSRFVYQLPLYNCNYVATYMIDDFLDGIRQHRPIIVDTSPSNKEVPPINTTSRILWRSELGSDDKAAVDAECEAIYRPVFTYLSQHYQEVGVWNEKGWVIYIHE